MPTCRVCQRHVEWFRGVGFPHREHPACRDERRAREARERAAAAALASSARAAALDWRRLDAFEREVDSAGVRREARDAILVQAFRDAVDAALDDHVLSEEEERSLASFRNSFELDDAEANRDGHVMRTAQAATLREVMEGNIPQRLQGEGGHPFNLMKSEQLVWAVPGTAYSRIKTVREFRGGSMGVSLRVASGVYVRPGAFRGRTVSREEMTYMDSGLLGLTTKHIYFHGPNERFRVRYDRIVSIEPYEDGIGIMRDTQRAKPEMFKTGEGWFVYNLATNLAQR